MRLKRAGRRVDPTAVPDPAPQTSPLERGFFRETADGVTVFFPWGTAHRGYVLPDAAAARRARRAVSLLFTAVVASAAWLAQGLQPLARHGAPALGDVARVSAWPLAALGVAVAAYALWAARLAERFPESDLRVSREERLREAAAHAEPWKLAVCGAVLAAASLAVAALDPRAGWLGVLGAAMGGVLVLGAWWMRRIAASASDPARPGDAPSGPGLS